MALDQVKVDCRLLNTGSCTVWEPFLSCKSKQRFVQAPSLAALLSHPSHGWILWDTGYAPRMLEATQRFPYRFYRWFTPLNIRSSDSALATVNRLGLAASDVGTVILSHFHADHVAGLLDFPSAEIVASKAAFAAVEHREGPAALRKAFLPALMPHDFRQRASLINFDNSGNLGILDGTHDLFDDGSIRMVDLPGHAAGQCGLFVQSNQGQLLFTADSFWSRSEVQDMCKPHPVMNLLHNDPKAHIGTQSRIHNFVADNPEVKTIPSHCGECWAEWCKDSGAQ